MGLSVEKITTFSLTGWPWGWRISGLCPPKSWRSMVGVPAAIFTALTNYWFKRKTYRYLTSLGPDKGAARELNH